MKRGVSHHRRLEAPSPVEPAKEDAGDRVQEDRPRHQCRSEIDRLGEGGEVTQAEQHGSDDDCSPDDARLRAIRPATSDAPPDEHEDRHEPEPEHEFLGEPSVAESNWYVREDVEHGRSGRSDHWLGEVLGEEGHHHRVEDDDQDAADDADADGQSDLVPEVLPDPAANPLRSMTYDRRPTRGAA